MHNISPYSNPKNEDVNTKNLLRGIWTKPENTLSYILAKCPDEHVAMLFVLGGITRSLGRAISHYPTGKMDAATILLLAIIGGSISGMITYTSYAWGMSLTGQWLGGKATSKQFKTVIGWALVPTITSLLLFIPALSLVGGETSIRITPAVKEVLFLGCGILEIALSIWSATILLKGIILIQGFKIGKALLNMLLPGVLLIGILILISSLW